VIVSIIVVTRDNRSELCHTLRSIGAQCFRDFFSSLVSLEVVVVDSSVHPVGMDEIRSCLGGYLAVRYFTDIPAQGIYSAMNVGLRESRGDLVHFLNSGDSLFDSTSLNRLLKHCFETQQQIPLTLRAVFGQALISPLVGSSCKPWLVPDPSVHSIHRWLNFYYPNHQSLLVDGSWARAHPFQTDAPQSADRVWMRAALSDPQRVAYLAEPVVRFSLGGVSSGLPDWPTLLVRLREPTRTWTEKLSEVVKFALRPWAGHYPRLMALRSNLIGRLV